MALYTQSGPNELWRSTPGSPESPQVSPDVHSEQDGGTQKDPEAAESSDAALQSDVDAPVQRTVPTATETCLIESKGLEALGNTDRSAVDLNDGKPVRAKKSFGLS